MVMTSSFLKMNGNDFKKSVDPKVGLDQPHPGAPNFFSLQLAYFDTEIGLRI